MEKLKTIYIFLAPSALGLPRLLDVCYNFSQCNDIVFDSLKSVYMVFRPKRCTCKLICPIVSLHLDRLNRIPETKYFGYLLSEDQSDDKDIAKQMRTLYIRSNKLLRMFSYCSSLYCCSMWSDYRKASYKKLTVAFNNVHRRMLNLPWRCSASAMYVNYNLPNLDTVIRRNLLGFIQRLSISQNSIIRALEHSWHIKHWDYWTKIL